MNATEQIALLRRACEMVADWHGHSNVRITLAEFNDKWGALDGNAVRAALLETLSATATPPDDDVARLTKERDALKEEVDWLAREWPSQVAAAIGSTPSRAGATPSMLSGCVQHEVARLTKERDDARLDRSAVLAQRDDALAKLRELHDIIEKHHNGYGETGKALGWKKPEIHAEALRDMLTEQVSMANNESTNEILRLYAELDTERMRLAACGVIAGCNTPDSYAINMRMHDSFKSGSLEQVAAAVRREMDLRDKLAAAQKELSDIYAANPEPGKPIVTEDNEGYLWIGCGIYARELRKVATGVTTADAQRIADALNGGGK